MEISKISMKAIGVAASLLLGFFVFRQMKTLFQQQKEKENNMNIQNKKVLNIKVRQSPNKIQAASNDNIRSKDNSKYIGYETTRDGNEDVPRSAKITSRNRSRNRRNVNAYSNSHAKCHSYVESLRAESLHDELIDEEPPSDFVASDYDLAQPTPKSASTSATDCVLESIMEQNFTDKATQLQEIKRDFERQIEEVLQKDTSADVEELKSQMLKKIQEVEIAIDLKQKIEIEEVRKLSFSN